MFGGKRAFGSKVTLLRTDSLYCGLSRVDSANVCASSNTLLNGLPEIVEFLVFPYSPRSPFRRVQFAEWARRSLEMEVHFHLWRKVRASQDTVVGNAHRPQGPG